MPNTFERIDHVAMLTSRLLADETHLARMFTRDYDSAFGGGRGSEVRVRIPGVLPTHTRAIGSTEPYVADSLSEKTVTVALEHEAYAHVVLSLADLDLNLVDAGVQVLQPMAETIAAHVESEIARELAEVPTAEAIAYNEADPGAAVIRARAALRKNGMGAAEQLYVLAGADVFAEFSLAKALDENGKASGLDVVESTSIHPRALYVFSSRALAVVLRAPRPSASANSASLIGENGAPITLTRAYDASNGAEVLTANVFAGVAPFPLVKNDHAEGTSTTVPYGAIVSIDTTPVV